MNTLYQSWSVDKCVCTHTLAHSIHKYAAGLSFDLLASFPFQYNSIRLGDRFENRKLFVLTRARCVAFPQDMDDRVAPSHPHDKSFSRRRLLPIETERPEPLDSRFECQNEKKCHPNI